MTFVEMAPYVQPFYKILATVLNFYGISDRTWWGYEKPNKFILFHRKIVIFFAPIALSSQCVFLALHFRTLSFSTLSVVLSILPVGCITNVCIFSAQRPSYEKIMKDLFHGIHLHNYKHLNEFAKSKVFDVEFYTRWTMGFLTVCLLTDCALWVFVPIVHYFQNIAGINNQSVMLETFVYFWTPFDYRYNVRNWVIMHIISSYVGFSAVAIIITFNTVNYLFVFHLIGHIQILKHRFCSEFTNTNNRVTKENLIGLIRNHSFIIKVYKDVQDAFSYIVTANYCHNLFSDSLLLYQIVFGEKSKVIMYGLMFLVYMGGLILMSIILEKIRQESDDLPNVIYSVSWESMSLSNKKTLMMTLVRAQPPIEFISAGGLRVGVRPVISIIKSTFSYYVMLKTNLKADS